jgi:hypothetical protein
MSVKYSRDRFEYFFHGLMKLRLPGVSSLDNIVINLSTVLIHVSSLPAYPDSAGLDR